MAKAYAITDDVWMVPCSIIDNQYIPLVRPFSENPRQYAHRKAWSPEEDHVLTEIIKATGPSGWSSIARELNNKIHSGVPIRLGKQCRERYFNHIDNSLVKGNWTDQEDIKILESQQTKGNKWSQIANTLPGRTENQVKNRFKSLYKQAVRVCPIASDPIANLIQQKRASLVDSKTNYSTHLFFQQL